MTTLRRPFLAAVICTTLAGPAPASTPNGDVSTLGAQPGTGSDTDQKALAQATEMKALIQRVKDTVAGAKKPEDLDSLLFDLQKYQNNGFDGGYTFSDNRDLLRQLVSALQFVKEWQNYLSNVAAGKMDMARSDLSNLSQANYDTGIIPRSKILALLHQPQGVIAFTATSSTATIELPEAVKIADSINSLDELEPALEKLRSMRDDPVAEHVSEGLAPMVEVYGDLKAGLPTKVNINFMGDVTGAGISDKANSLLLNFILQHYFDTYKGGPPGDSETPAAYVTRVKAEALAGQDWTLLKKALQAHSYLYRNVAQPGTSEDETAGLDDMMAGLNQENAGQYALAVKSYQTALKTANLDLPAKFIGQHLDAIKSGHPTEYDSGMEQFLAPQPPTPPPGFPPGFNPFFNPAFNYPAWRRAQMGLPGIPVPPNPAELSIPGASSGTNTTASPATNAPAAAH